MSLNSFFGLLFSFYHVSKLLLFLYVRVRLLRVLIIEYNYRLPIYRLVYIVFCMDGAIV